MVSARRGWLTLTSSHTRTPVHIRCESVDVVGEVFPAGAKPEDKPTYTEIYRRGSDTPLWVEERREAILFAVQGRIDD